MSALRGIAVLGLLLAGVGADRAAAQGTSSVAQPVGAETGWNGLRPPYGAEITEVADGGRYVTLRDGTVWEVEISDRATTGSWGDGDFVVLEPIFAPRGPYEYRLVRSREYQTAAARLVGRAAATPEAADSVPD
jgi:hypothetical protein